MLQREAFGRLGVGHVFWPSLQPPSGPPYLLRLALVFLFAGLMAGCRPTSAPSGERTPPRPDSPALYGPPSGVASTSIPRARPPIPVSVAWSNAEFAVVQTELSPGILVRSTGRRLDLFGGTTNTGLAAPTFVAWSTMNGPRTFRRNEKLDVARMRECWILVWWAGAAGWLEWDAPWVVYLQHQPEAMTLDDDGLHLSFSGRAGEVVLLPLYGYEKLPQRGHDFLAAHGLAGRKVQTWDWPEVLKRDPLTRLRYWAAMLREVPVYCEENISVDRRADQITIRSRFEWHSIRDDWNTPHLRFAPISPPLGLVATLGGFPVEFSKRWSDLDYATPSGPYLGIEGVDQYDAVFSVLQYVNETEASDPPVTSAGPGVGQALARLTEVASRKFSGPDGYEHDLGGLGQFCWAIQGDGWYAKALPYYEPLVRSAARTSLSRYFHKDALATNRFVQAEDPPGSGRFWSTLEGRGLGSGGKFGEAGTLAASMLGSLWAYAHYSVDWDLVRQEWPRIKRLFTSPAETSWASFGRTDATAIGDEAAPSAAFARLAYQAGDLDAYHHGCAQFARELVHLYLKQRGAEYFRKRQPWHSLEYLDEEVFLTFVRDDGTGWQLDGPHITADVADGPFTRRWVRFQDADVARFHREYLAEDVRRELNWLQHRWAPERRLRNEPHLVPSLVQLRSLLLNETPSQLALMPPPDQFTGPPSGIIASCLAVLRTSHPTRFDRLIPPASPSPFVIGLERDVSGPNPVLVTGLEPGGGRIPRGVSLPAWPELTWRSWTTPRGSPWTFGAIRSGPAMSAGRSRETALNWNTRVLSWDHE